MLLRRFAVLTAFALSSTACSSSDPAGTAPAGDEDADVPPEDSAQVDSGPADTSTAADSTTDSATDSSGADASDGSSDGGADVDVVVDAGPEPCSKDGEVQSEPCGKCGKRARLCDMGTWLPWGACLGETGACAPGDTRSNACGKCGTRVDTCSTSCTWESGACTSEGVCNLGDQEVQYGACPVSKEVKVRTCGSTCSWSDWSTCTAPKGWNDIPVAPITARYEHTAVWTGTKMIVWGGRSSTSTGAYLADGAAFDLATETWSALPASGITGRWGHTAVWTGSEMIVWGGSYSSSYHANGASYDPAANTWTSLAAPPSTFYARRYHTAVYAPTTKEMIVYGGYGTSCSGTYCADGAAYDTVNKTWRTIKASPLPGRYWHSAVWAGSRMVVFGGYGTGCPSPYYCRDAAAYDPVTDSWSTLTPPASVDGRRELVGLAAGPSGDLAAFWGGYNGSVSPYDRDDGVIFDASAGTWKAIPSVGAATLPGPGRYHHVAWFGAGKLWIWAGRNYSSSLLATGASFDLSTEKWTAMPTTGAPVAREWATAVWTGSEAIVWGGYSGSARNDGKIFRP